MSFTTYINLEKPAYRTLRFDTPLNANFDRLDDALRCFASGTELGTGANYSDVTVTEGMLWRDTTNNILKVRGAAAWEYLLTHSRANYLTNVSAPGAVPTDSFYFYANDIVAGNAAPHFKTETGTIIKLYQQAHVANASVAHSVTAPADSPASADALRDDLVTNTISSINTALNALGTIINSILTYMENLGFNATS